MKTNTDDDALQKDVRTDLWPTMTVGQLYIQQEIVIEKMSKLLSILTMGDTSNITQDGKDSSVMSLYRVLARGAADLSLLIESKSNPAIPKVMS